MDNFYIFTQLLVVSIAATSSMTLFSYAVSASFRELYKEPVLLNLVMNKINSDSSIESTSPSGWLLHYIIGFLFVLAYHQIWVHDILPISALSALLLGAASGIIGILSWVILFKFSNHQPPIDFKGYYVQLFVAHMIFAIVATLLYSLSLTILILAKAYVTV
jgi:hypothetical protein